MTERLRDEQLAWPAVRLSDAERATLRATGAVPDWFLPEVTEVARHII